MVNASDFIRGTCMHYILPIYSDQIYGICMQFAEIYVFWHLFICSVVGTFVVDTNMAITWEVYVKFGYVLEQISTNVTYKILYEIRAVVHTYAI